MVVTPVRQRKLGSQTKVSALDRRYFGVGEVAGANSNTEANDMNTNAQDLSAKSGPELVSLFNSIPGVTPVKRFASRPAGIKRILAALAENPEATVEEPKPAIPVGLATALGMTVRNVDTGEIQKPDEPVRRRGRQRQERGTYNVEAGPIRRSHRANSTKGRLFDALVAGATFEQLQEQFDQLTETQLHRKIREMAWWLGYELRTDSDGVIRVIVD